MYAHTFVAVRPACYAGTVAQQLRVELEQEADGRWLAEVIELPGVLAYGATRDHALAKAEALALRVIADRLEHGERAPELKNLFIAA
jgi:predicted RNase H-like HicB family nuclease